MTKLTSTDQRKIAILNRLVTHYGEQHWWEDKNWVYDGVSMILIQQSTQNVQANLLSVLLHRNCLV